jgi:2-C-methyl-D-erythritol 4-phosphate cytidylyltransferase
MHAAAILPAAGQGIRMQFGRPKALIPLLRRPMLAWTLQTVLQSDLFSEVFVACPPGDEQSFSKVLPPVPGGAPTRFVAGGETRQESVQNCLDMVSADCELVAIHDGARPLVTQAILRDTLQKAAETGAALAAVASKDTVKECDERGVVVRTLARERLRLVQTPQCFRLEHLKKAFEAARSEGFSATDDAAIVERLGVEVHIVTGSYENIKVTTPEDILICEEILRRRQSI